MTEQQIQYFLTLVEEQSFSKAAKKLFVTQPSFSQYIQKLEKQMGAKLFDRSSIPIRLTQEGEAVYHAACEIRSIQDELTLQIRTLRNLEAGSLRLGTTPFRGSTLLSKSIKKYHSVYPGIQIKILEKPLEELSSSLLNGECDLAISSGNINHNLFHTEELASEKLYMAVSKDNPINELLQDYRLEASDIINNSLRLLKIPSCQLEQFASQPYIMYEGYETISNLTHKIFDESSKKPEIYLKLTDMYTVFSFVAADMGISILPDFLIRYGNFQSHPYYYCIKSQHNINHLYLITKKNRVLTQAAQEYCRILKELIVSGTWRD